MKNLLNYLLITALSFISISTNAQDIISKKNGTVIKAKVIEITDTEVKYTESDNASGEILTFPKFDLLTIKYKKGKTEYFNVPDLEEGYKDVILGKRIETYQKSKTRIGFYQENNEVKFKDIYKTLKEADFESENMPLAKKYYKRKHIYLFLLVIPSIPAGEKFVKYLKLSIEDYNNSL